MVTWICGHFHAMTAQVGPPVKSKSKSERGCANGGPWRGPTDVTSTDCNWMSEKRLQKEGGRVRTAADFLYVDWGHLAREKRMG
jgi:hypothetical protein